MRSSRYEAGGKFGEEERGVASSNSSFLSATKTSQVLHTSMNAQLTHEPIVLYENFFPRDLFDDVMSVHNRNMKHVCAIEFD